jgi:hypothetical protein
MHRSSAVIWLLLVIAACTTSKSPAERFTQGPWIETTQGYSIRGWARMLPGPPDTLVFGATMANRSRQTVLFRSSGCGPRAEAYLVPQRAGPPAWESHQEDCATGHQLPVAPGDSLPAGFSIVVATVPDVLGDSLPEGRYFFAIYPSLAIAPPSPLYGPRPPEDDSLPKHPISVPAGSLLLKRR